LRYNDRHNNGETGDLLAMRAGRISGAEYERRHGITNTADPRHAAWYRAHRAQVEADPSVREFRAHMRAQGRAFPEAPAASAGPGEWDLMKLADVLDRSARFDDEFPEFRK
jgi:hypothetical protein